MNFKRTVIAPLVVAFVTAMPAFAAPDIITVDRASAPSPAEAAARLQDALDAAKPAEELSPLGNRSQFYLMPKIGTLGYGVDVGYQATDMLGGRVIWRDYSSDFDFDVDEDSFDASVDIGGFGALVDFYPTRGNFRISGGIMQLDNSAEVSSTITRDYTSGGVPTTGSADIKGKVEYNSTSPMLAIGWHDYVGKNFSYDISLGAVYMGSPEISLRSVGGVAAGEPEVEAEIDDLADDIEDDLSGLNFYPVIEFGMTFHF